VDTELLPEGCQQKEMRLTFYLTENALFMLRDFFEKTMKFSVNGVTFSDLIPGTTGQHFLGTVTQEVSGDRIFSNIDRTAPAE